MTEEQTPGIKEENAGVNENKEFKEEGLEGERFNNAGNSDNSRAFVPHGTPDNIVFIGSKPLVNYVRGVIMQFRRNGSSEVIIRSRGKFISKAVDVAEISRRSLEEDKIGIKDIKISSESFETKEKKTNISTMDIVLGVSFAV